MQKSIKKKMTVSGNSPLELAPWAGCGSIFRVEAGVCGGVWGAVPSLLCPRTLHVKMLKNQGLVNAENSQTGENSYF